MPFLTPPGAEVNVSRAMATSILMPQLGESITEGTIVRWYKNIGDIVALDEPLLEVSTDKVDAEIPSPAAGVLTEIRAGEGQTVLVDSVVALIGHADDIATNAAPAGPVPSAAGSPARVADAASSSRPAAARDRPQYRPTLSPVVRKLAREHGIDPGTIRGTGTGGRVTKADVLSAVRDPQAGSSRSEPMSAIRRVIAQRMVESRRTSAHVHTVFDVNFSRVAELRASRRASYEHAGIKLSFLVFVARAAVAALRDVPIVNASLDGETIVYGSDVNLGIAVALDWGLIVPVVKRAQNKTMFELGQALTDLSDRARSKQLTPDDVTGGTFTITNPGGFGSIFGMPIINQLQLAILCMGAVEDRPWVVDGEVVAQTRAYLTLAFDHRVIDGEVADRFMSTLKRLLEGFDESLL
jgi:pyruvate dehydrogenase E2 component (dihydrolipoamide acetyltransferase)